MEFRSFWHVRWYLINHKASLDHQIGFFGILLAVQIESFLWGFGTALGELPPYFVAKKISF